MKNNNIYKINRDILRSYGISLEQYLNFNYDLQQSLIKNYVRRQFKLNYNDNELENKYNKKKALSIFKIK